MQFEISEVNIVATVARPAVDEGSVAGKVSSNGPTFAATVVYATMAMYSRPLKFFDWTSERWIRLESRRILRGHVSVRCSVYCWPGL